MPTANAPTQIVILGGTGDLSKRKLLPALFDLYCKDKLPQKFQIIGQAKTDRTDNEYREFVASVLEQDKHDHTKEQIQNFTEHLSYIAGDFADTSTYKSLQNILMAYQEQIGMCTNRLFYLAVPPEYYEQIFKSLHKQNMNEPCDSENGWTRILVEKPFGSDYASARILDEKLSSLFKEEQIFRIDHYLAKEAVQNILSFRFANPLITSTWNKDYIESIHIEMKETIDVGGRGDFYEAVGALRDVGQNHLLQILALLTMSQPAKFDAAHIRKERAYILQSLQSYAPKTCQGKVRRGQYEGFLETAGVDCSSDTETYFELITQLDTDIWKGVPIHIRAGKGLDEAVVRATITFKETSHGLFEDNYQVAKNQTILTLSPSLDIAITLNNKRPGYDYRVEPDTLNFKCRNDDGAITNAYEKVLLDCIDGDQTLFTATDEVLAAWKYISSILENWQNVPIETYTKGESGPEKLTI